MRRRVRSEEEQIKASISYIIILTYLLCTRNNESRYYIYVFDNDVIILTVHYELCEYVDQAVAGKLIKTFTRQPDPFSNYPSRVSTYL